MWMHQYYDAILYMNVSLTRMWMES